MTNIIIVIFQMKDSHEKKVMVTFRVTETELRKFDRIAEEKQISRAALLRGYVIETNKKNKVKLE